MMIDDDEFYVLTAAGGEVGFDSGQGRCAAKKWTALAGQ